MMTFGPCFAGLFSRNSQSPLSSTQFTHLREQFCRVSGQSQSVDLRTQRIAAIAATLENLSVRSTALWVHPEQKGCALLDGDVHNRQELLIALALNRDDGQPSNAELAYAAYRRWGRACMDHLVGDIVVVIYDEQQGLLCAIDPSGERPVFLNVDENVVRFASHPLLLCEQSVRYDRQYLTNYLAHEPCDDTRTAYAGVWRLRPGYAVHVDNSGKLEEFRWWQPPQRGSLKYPKRSDYAAHLRELLMEATLCRMGNHRKIGVLLSGGIDSGAVTTCANELIRTGRISPESFTAYTVSSPDNPRSDESPFAAEVAAGIGVNHQRIPAPKLPDMQALARIAAGMPYPTGHIFLAPWFHEVARVTQPQGITLMMTGAAGEIFLGDLSSLSLLLFKRRYLQFLKEVALLWRGGVPIKSILLPVLYGLRDSSRTGFGTDADAGRRSPVFGSGPDPLTRELDMIVTEAERIDRWDMAIFRPVGMQSKAPFLDRRLLEFAFAIPYELNIPSAKGEVPKPLLRQAFPEVPYEVSWKAHRVGLEDMACSQWGGSAQIDALEKLLADMDGAFDEVLNRRDLAEQLPGLRRPDRMNDIAEALALAIWSNALRTTAGVGQFV